MNLRPLVLIALLLTSCARKEAVPHNEWIFNAIDSPSDKHDKWIIGGNGGSDSAGGHIVFYVLLRGATPAQALKELKARFIEHLRRAHFAIDDLNPGDTHHYTFKLTAPRSVGSLTVGAIQKSPEELSVNMAFVQALKPK
jgi:hypothetical protein